MSDKKAQSTVKKMLMTAGFMAVATLLSKVLGLARDSMLTAYFGSGMESDAFTTASTIPTMLFDVVIGGVISAAFIPVFNDILLKRGRDDAMRFVNKFVTMILCIAVLISIFGIIFSPSLVSLQAQGYSPEKHALASRLTSIMFPMIIFTGLAFSFVGLLQSFGEYNIPSIISLVSNLAIILYYVIFGKKFGVYGLSVTMVIAWSLQFIIQIPWIRKFGVKFRFDFRFRDSDIMETIRLAGPMLISTWVQPLYTIVNQRFASNIDSAVTSIQQSNRLYIIVVGVFSFVVTNLIFPKLSQAVAEGNEREAKKLASASMRAVVMVIAPIMAMFMLLSEPIAFIIFGYGEMDAEHVRIVSSLLRCYSIGMIGLALNEVLSKTFFSFHDSKTPMRNSIISMAVNIALAYVLYRTISTNGLALAAAAGSIVNAALNWFCAKRKYPDMITVRDVFEMAKSVIAAAISAGAIYFVYGFAYGKFSGRAGDMITCVICAAAGLVVYGAMLIIMRSADIKNLLGKRG